MSTRSALTLALVGLAASSTFAFAADAPKTSTTSKTLFLAQNGCGSTAEAGRLETTAQSDSADGCGVIGGVPLTEVEAADESDFGPLGTDFTSTKKLTPFKIDASKKVTGQLEAGSWVGNGTGGVGTVTFDVAMIGKTTAGKTIDFGSVKASAAASPGQDTVDVPFELAAPASAVGATMKSFTLTIFQHGQNYGMSASQFSGASYVVIASKK